MPRVELALATRQLGVLLEAGAPLHQALETLYQSATHPGLKEILGEVVEKITRGHPLSQALGQHPRVFSRTYQALVRVGEETGAITKTFRSLAEWLERDLSVTRQLSSALIYPCGILTVAMLLGLAFFWWILPGFEETLSGIPLPLLTRVLFNLSALLRWPGTWALALLGLGGAWLGLRGRSLPVSLQLRLWSAVLRMALVGPLLRNASVARLAASMEALLSTGASLTRSLHLSAEASGNPLLVEEMRRVEKAISQGEELADHFDGKAYLFPSVMVSLVRVGEEAAVLPAMFGHLAQMLDEDLQFRVRTLLALLEPVLMAIISLVVALLIVGIAMPLYAFLQSAL